jgi:hypothetical protein
MHDYRYDRVNSLAAHERARTELAAKMADYERKHGPVTTLPILVRGDSAAYNNRTMTNARARRRGCDVQRKPTPLTQRGTRQAKKNAALREEWS